MAGYAVIARIGRVEPQLTLHDLERDLETGGGGDAAVATGHEGAAFEILREPEMGRFAERMLRMRELWVQTTFYLFDTDSWRS